MPTRAFFGEYEAEVAEVVSGDTIKCRINFGLETTGFFDVRLASIRAPSVLEHRGVQARNLLKGLIAGRVVRLEISMDTPFGEIFAAVFDTQSAPGAKSANDFMRETGLVEVLE